MPGTIELGEEHFLGQGGTRWVFFHPEDPDRCIKIPFPDCGNRLKAIRREERYLQKYKRQGKDFTHLPEFHGYLETSRGTGAVFTLIRDADGSPSRTMRSYLKGGGDVEAVRVALAELRDNLLQNCILFHDISAKNLLAQQKEGLRLVMADGIGNSDFIKINEMIPALARRKIRRKWARILKKIPAAATP